MNRQQVLIVELRNDMWKLVEELKEQGVTIILTTHYIEEAEEVADRVAIINHGDILLVEEKSNLMERLGKKELIIELQEPADEIASTLADLPLTLSDDGSKMTYYYDAKQERTGITKLLAKMSEAGMRVKDLQTHTSSLEDIFVSLVQDEKSEDALSDKGAVR